MLPYAFFWSSASSSSSCQSSVWGELNFSFVFFSFFFLLGKGIKHEALYGTPLRKKTDFYRFFEPSWGLFTILFLRSSHYQMPYCIIKFCPVTHARARAHSCDSADQLNELYFPQCLSHGHLISGWNIFWKVALLHPLQRSGWWLQP